jgi:hypothetical protein
MVGARAELGTMAACQAARLAAAMVRGDREDIVACAGYGGLRRIVHQQRHIGSVWDGR